MNTKTKNDFTPVIIVISVILGISCILVIGFFLFDFTVWILLGRDENYREIDSCMDLGGAWMDEDVGCRCGTSSCREWFREKAGDMLIEDEVIE